MKRVKGPLLGLKTEYSRSQQQKVRIQMKGPRHVNSFAMQVRPANVRFFALTSQQNHL